MTKYIEKEIIDERSFWTICQIEMIKKNLSLILQAIKRAIKYSNSSNPLTITNFLMLLFSSILHKIASQN